MDAIKKKMQAMKVDKDGALERALVCEQEARDANTRAEKVSTQPCHKNKNTNNYLLLQQNNKKKIIKIINDC